MKIKRKGKSIIVVGLVGYNLGDEAIALAVLKRLRNFAKIKVVSFQKKSISKYGYEELYFSPRSLKAWMLLFLSIVKADVVLVGGGSLVQDKLGGGFSSGILGYVNLVTLVSWLFRKLLVSLPIGVDDLSVCNYPLANSILSRFDYLFVRDERSRLNALAFSGGLIDPVVVTDPVFDKHHELWLTSSSECTDMPIDSSSPYICVALAKENTLRENSLLVHEIVECIEAWLGSGYKVVLLSMDSRGDDETAIYQNITSIISSRGGQVVGELAMYTPSDVYGAVRCIRNARFMLAMRLHAMIIGYSYVSMFCLSRTTKTHAFCEEYGVGFVDIDASQSLPPAVLSDLALGDFSKLSNKFNGKLLFSKQELLDEYFAFLVSLVGRGESLDSH